MKIRNIWILIIGLTCMNSANSELVGLGQESCGTFLSDFKIQEWKKGLARDDKRYSSWSGVYAQWIFGYISGATINHQNSLPEHVTWTDVLMSIENYCTDNPTSKLANAVDHFMKVHMK